MSSYDKFIEVNNKNKIALKKSQVYRYIRRYVILDSSIRVSDKYLRCSIDVFTPKRSYSVLEILASGKGWELVLPNSVNLMSGTMLPIVDIIVKVYEGEIYLVNPYKLKKWFAVNIDEME